jgi:trehalose-phosphatase
MSVPDVARAYEAIAGIARAHHLLLLFDFDGTLCAFNPDPSAVWLSDERRDHLLTIGNRATIAIVSGRRLDDVRRRAGLPASTFCAGLHGLEIEGGGEHFIHPDASAAADLLASLEGALTGALAGMSGAFVEQKTLSLALHFRSAEPAATARAREQVLRVAQPHMDGGRLRVMEGASILELLPNIPWNKGDAVNWIHQRVRTEHSDVTCVYVGDDVTDEDAFRTLRNRGLSIAASDRVSGADHRIEGPDDVGRLLALLAERWSTIGS